MESRERDATGIRTLRIGYNRVFGYYIEVSKSFKDKVPLNYQRRQTLANAERYTTDELKEIEEKILTSEDSALRLEAELYENIKRVLSSNINNLKRLSHAVARLDVLTSFARVAKSNRYVRPVIVGGDKPLIIKEGRHPVVEVISKERFVANDTLFRRGRKPHYDNNRPQYGGQEYLYAPDGAYNSYGAHRQFRPRKVGRNSYNRQNFHPRGCERQPHSRPEYVYG